MRYFVFIAIIVFVISCGKKSNAPLNEEDFTNLLIDIHLTDAILGVDGHRSVRGREENQKYYNYIFKKYGITSSDFDSCVMVYSKDLVIYEKIYQEVVDSLNHLKSRYDREFNEKLRRDTLNLWKLKEEYSFPKDSANLIECDIPFNERGMYNFSLRIKIKEGDKGINNRLTGYFVKKTKLGADSIIPFDTTKLRTDTIWRYYSLHKFVEDTNYTHLHIKILDCDNVDSLVNRSVEVKSIKLVNPLYEEQLHRFEEFPRR